MSMPAMYRTAPVFFLALLLSGCGSSSAGPLVAVTGTVSYHGIPLPGGMVVFTPDSARGGQGHIATATTQPDGSFTLTTGEADGAAPGWHRITVVSISDGGMSPGARYTTPVSLIPEKYRSAELSGLTREVFLNQENVFHLNLD